MDQRIMDCNIGESNGEIREPRVPDKDRLARCSEPHVHVTPWNKPSAWTSCLKHSHYSLRRAALAHTRQADEQEKGRRIQDLGYALGLVDKFESHEVGRGPGAAHAQLQHPRQLQHSCAYGLNRWRRGRV